MASRDAHKRQRTQKFEKFYQEFKMDGNLEMIPGYKERDPSFSMMLKFMSIKGLKLPKAIKVPDDWDISAQFHMTFFFENAVKKFFFGRSARSSVVKMKPKAGNVYETDKNDYVYFHTNLNKKEKNMEENIKIVIETVIICEREGRDGKEEKYLSGGYSVFTPFKSKNDGQLIDVYEGTPRDLITGIEG